MGGLIAPFGTFFRRESVAPTETVGSSGTVILAGYIQSTERNPKVKGEQRWRTYSDLLSNIDVVGASIRYYLNLGTKAGWTVEAADDSPAAEEVKEFVEDALDDMRTPWRRVVRRALMYRMYGFSVQEWTAKMREDGRLGLLDIEPRTQSTIERWDTDETGHVLGMTQRHPTTGREAYLPREKVVYVVDDSLSDSPEGFGIFRQMVETAQRLRRYQDLEAFGFETDLRGIPKARAPLAELREAVRTNRLTEAQVKAIRKPLEDFIKNHVKTTDNGVLLDSSTYKDQGESAAPSSTPKWDLELLTGGNTAAEAVARAIERLQRELARLCGTEGLLLGGDRTGSLALARNKTESLALIVDSALSELAETFEKDIVGVLMELNAIPDDLWPSLIPEQIQYMDVEQITMGLQALSTAGAPLMPGDPAINVVRGIMGLPDEPEVDPNAMNGLRPGEEDDPDPPPTGDGDEDEEDLPPEPGSGEDE